MSLQKKELKDALKSSNFDAIAVDDLDAIFDFLAESDKETRELAVKSIRSLAQLDRFTGAIRTAIPLLISRLDDNNKYLRCSIIEVIRELTFEYTSDFRDDYQYVLDKLVARTDDHDKDVRSTAIMGLGGLCYKFFYDFTVDFTPAILKIIGKVNDKDDEVKSAAKGALQNFSFQFPDIIEPCISDMIGLLDVDDDDARVLVSSILAESKLSEPVVQHIAEIEKRLDANNSGTRERSLFLLGRLYAKHPDRLQPPIAKIIDMLNDTDGNIRAMAAAFFGGQLKLSKSDYLQAIPNIIKLIDDKDSFVRLRGVYVLASLVARFPDDLFEYIPQFTKLADDEDEKVQEAVVDLLHKLAERSPNDPRLSNWRNHGR